MQAHLQAKGDLVSSYHGSGHGTRFYPLDLPDIRFRKNGQLDLTKSPEQSDLLDISAKSVL